jgi:glycosyltransferase involved in cell wall biosynthesis
LRLVFVTQVLDRQDAVLGFVSRWVRGLAEAAEQVRVVALEVGDTSGLPDNVDWVELGRRGAVGRYLRYRRALGDAFGRGPSGGFDGLLTHMVPRYSTVAAGWAARAGVAHYLWYTHKGVDRRLLRAIERVDGVFTASEESLRVETPKRIVTGHGIDAEHFDVAPVPLPASVPASGPAPGSAEAGGAALLSVGRLTAAKDPVCILDAVARLRAEGRDVTLTWAGGGLVARDDQYAGRVMEAVRELGLGDAVRFVGAVPYPRVPELYAAADLFVSASRTGSVDKVLLEAMAARRPLVSCNDSLGPLLSSDPALAPWAGDCTFPVGDGAALAERVACWLDLDAGERGARAEALRAHVVREHDVDRLMARLVRTMEARGGADGAA